MDNPCRGKYCDGSGEFQDSWICVSWRNYLKIQKASNEVGFEADDIPLMVEAIPLSSESIMLIITKIEDPEELDTRFSRFSPGNEDEPLTALANELLEARTAFKPIY